MELQKIDAIVAWCLFAAVSIFNILIGVLFCCNKISENSIYNFILTFYPKSILSRETIISDQMTPKLVYRNKIIPERLERFARMFAMFGGIGIATVCLTDIVTYSWLVREKGCPATAGKWECYYKDKKFNCMDYLHNKSASIYNTTIINNVICLQYKLNIGIAAGIALGRWKLLFFLINIAGVVFEFFYKQCKKQARKETKPWSFKRIHITYCIIVIACCIIYAAGVYLLLNVFNVTDTQVLQNIFYGIFMFSMPPSMAMFVSEKRLIVGHIYEEENK